MGTVVGALVALVVVFASQWLQPRSRWKQEHWDRRLEVTAEIISAVVEMNRRLTNYAYTPAGSKHDRTLPVVNEYYSSAIAWNAAIGKGLALLPPSQATSLLDLDREIDRLLERAVSAEWERTEFRSEREPIGELAMQFINEIRGLAGEEPLLEVSIWSWAS